MGNQNLVIDKTEVENEVRKTGSSVVIEVHLTSSMDKLAGFFDNEQRSASH